MNSSERIKYDGNTEKEEEFMAHHPIHYMNIDVRKTRCVALIVAHLLSPLL